MRPDDRFTIDPDIRRAATPPAWVYRDADVYARELERVFARTWHFAMPAAGLPQRGHAVPFTFLEGFLDEPLVLTRDAEDQLHCLSNVCTHRGNLVVEEAGPVPHLRCRYHGRRFALDGSMRFMPEFEEAEGFPRPEDDLPHVANARFGPVLFAALTPRVSFDDLVAPVRERVGWLPIESFEPDAGGSRDYFVAANWALYCDNYLEGFHIPYVHRALNATLDYGSYTTETFPYGCVQIGIAEPGEAAFDLPIGHPDHGKRIGAYYFWLFPSTMLNFYPWGLSVNVVTPLGVDRTRVTFLSFVHDPSMRGTGAGGDLHTVELEDEDVVTNVQKGVRSRLYDRGRYSPTREIGVHHFHRLLATFLYDM
jgi:choline monooxygenase